MENLTSALLITLAGMGLVFGAILVFWLSMTGLLRWSERTRVDSKQSIAVGADEVDEQALREQAALAAVAFALATERAQIQPHPFPLPKAAQVSSWQAVMRARSLGGPGARG